jgi:hypothetical protein
MDDVSSPDIARRRPARFVLGDMARSLGLLAVVIVALLFIGPARALILPGDRDRMPAVDYAGYARGFTEATYVQAVLPAELPDGWRANAARNEHVDSLHQLHIGWAVPGEQFVGLDEGVGDPSLVLRRVTGRVGLDVRDTTTIGGATWDVRRSARDELVLTRTFGAVFVVVTGSGSKQQLRQFAATLH